MDGRMLVLIGFTGFVGSSLVKQASFDVSFRSTNIHEIQNKSFETIVCAGAPAQKWIANKEPEADLQTIQNLIGHLKTIKCKTFILISTVDVFHSPLDVNENTKVDEEGLQPYGLHRRLLEKFVEKQFKNCLIIRLPSLVGPGLRKNIVFDFLNNKNIEMIESRNIFQFYPMVNLWADIQTSLRNKIKLIHLTAEPITVADIASKGFNFKFTQALSEPPTQYNMKTCHSNIFGKVADYQYSKAETLLAIRSYAQSEPKALRELEDK